MSFSLRGRIPAWQSESREDTRLRERCGSNVLRHGQEKFVVYSLSMTVDN
jgi:hypothetical protein